MFAKSQSPAGRFLSWSAVDPISYDSHISAILWARIYDGEQLVHYKNM